MALTMNDLKTVNDFNANNYGVEIGMNEQFQYFVTVKVNDVDHVIHTASGKIRFTRNLPFLIQEICSMCSNAKTISLNFEGKLFVMENSSK